MAFLFKIRSGKNFKWLYFLRNFSSYLIPSSIFRVSRERTLKGIEKREDFSYIQKRVNYYNKLERFTMLPENAPHLYSHTYPNWEKQSVYFFDTYRYTRWFPKTMQWRHLPGDITEIPSLPTIVKSRPISKNNENSILLNLNKLRHFIFIKDSTPFSHKINKVLFRGKVAEKPCRELFFRKYFGHYLCDIGAVDCDKMSPKEWSTPKMTIRNHFKYKFILALEGIDVASNLKWIMFSNSIAVMPRPTYETWFMEGELIPNYHYIEIKSDYSDFEEKINYYIEHEEEAQKIVKNAHEYVTQFLDKKRERLISLMVMEKYFKYTNAISKSSSIVKMCILALSSSNIFTTLFE